MRRSWVEKLEKAAFVVGLGVLAYLGGFATHMFAWAPSAFLQRAWLQVPSFDEPKPPDFTKERVHFWQGARVVLPEEVQPGLTLVTSVWRDSTWAPGLRLIDRNGRVLHHWSLDPEGAFPDSASRRRGLAFSELDIQGSRLLPDGDVLVNLEYVGTVRMDACGRIRWRLPGGGHHAIHRAEDGSFWIPGVTPEPRSESPGHPDGLPGFDRPVYQDQLVRVSPDGEVLDVINLLDVLYANDLYLYLGKTSFGYKADPTHLNDVESLSSTMADGYPLFDAGDLVVSLRHLDLVFVLDPESRRVRWHVSDPLLRQHDPDFLGDGWIGVFNNRSDGTLRGEVLGGSQIVALQPHTDSMKVLFPGAESDPFFTHVRGKWQLLANGNLLLTESAAGRVVEVTPEGRTAWEWVVEPYGEDRTPFVSKAVRVDLTPEDVASWPCSRRFRTDDQLRADP